MGIHGKSHGYFRAVDEAAGFYEAGKTFQSGWGLRCTIFPTGPGGGLAVYNPVARLRDEIHGRIAALGEVRWLIAPNHFHNLGLREWAGRYPRAEILSSPQASPRLHRVIGLLPGDIAKLAIPAGEGVRVLTPPGLKNGEVWVALSSGAGTLLLVCDAFCFSSGTSQGAAGMMIRLISGGKGLRVPRTWHWFAIERRQEYWPWVVQTLKESPPVALIPCHGEIFREPQLVERLTALATANAG